MAARTACSWSSVALVAVVVVVNVGGVHAQSPAGAVPDAASAPADSADAQEPTQSTDRLFWTLPNFLTVENSEHVPPLTSKQKFDVVTRSAFDYVEFAWYGVLAGVSQSTDDETGYGVGWRGYAKRYASEFSDGTIENFMVGAVMPSVFHQDPRYYQMGRGGVWSRAAYAVTRLAVTRTDSGRHQFNISETLGSAATAALSTTYRPADDRHLTTALTTWGSQVGYDALSNVLKEFWPDIRRHFSKH
jgi:hypothetical protein